SRHLLPRILVPARTGFAVRPAPGRILKFLGSVGADAGALGGSGIRRDALSTVGDLHRSALAIVLVVVVLGGAGCRGVATGRSPLTGLGTLTRLVFSGFALPRFDLVVCQDLAFELGHHLWMLVQ